MSAVCPEGHTSQATDYCDICGAPMAAPGAGAAGSPSGSGESGASSGTGSEPTTCPHCQAPAPAGALFCENCGYDFTTGTAPSSSSRFAAPGSQATPAPGAGSGSAQVLPAPPQQPGSALDLDPLEAPVAVAVEPAAGAGESGEGAEGESEGTGAEGEGAADPAVDPAVDPAANEAADPEATPATGLPTPSVPGPDEWVAEVWIDPDWYAAQGPEDPIPSVGMPLVVPLRSRSVLVGRPSRSRGIHPDVDCGTDTGVSRRQCQLSTDGLRWWVEDLQSANGTYLSPVGEPLPSSPITVGARQELEEGARIFVGGWTRIVVRRGIPGEV
ncbi:FHA domain-containing protein [Serinibacter arcticus]|uniref:FraH-related protein n=1 Tax=Serinibacter arcticus TaxID=1655435 RepID=A0A4Z1E7D3_9MICO|nr:FHA domain-containing protein [Serinibacter arcticus]TGO05597.1 FraH-related protein [Serinibacter arcticus]